MPVWKNAANIVVIAVRFLNTQPTWLIFFIHSHVSTAKKGKYMFAIFACGSLDILQRLTVPLCGYSIKLFKTRTAKSGQYVCAIILA
jgi:hypothetical protein